jgi:hypothetical protein
MNGPKDGEDKESRERKGGRRWSMAPASHVRVRSGACATPRGGETNQIRQRTTEHHRGMRKS